jgi:hypothetical protein
MRGNAVVWCAALALGLAGCGDSESGVGNGVGLPNNPGDGGNNGTNNGGFNNGSNNGFEPEPEERFNFQAPQPSRNYVFVANTALDTVARIDGDTLEIVSVEVGDEPTVVRAWAESDVAAVLNEGSDDVSIIHSGSERIEVVTLPIREGFNALIMAPGGEYALAYLDYTDYAPGDDLGRFQDVNLIRLREGEEEVFNVAVGFRVLEVEFDEEGERAFVITEDGISVIRMDDVRRDTSAQPIAVSSDLSEDALAVDREVEITRDGSLALVRSSVLEGVNLINLRDRALVQVALPGVPTDLDLYPDSARAVAVLKGPRQVASLELGELLEDPEAVTLIDVPEGPLGLAAVDFEADLALLYSVTEGSPQITRLELDTGAQVVWDVRKALRGVHISPSGDRAMLFHAAIDTPRSNDAADVYLANSHAYTLLDLQTGFTKLQTAPTEPGEFVFSGDNRFVFVVLNDVAAQVRQVDRVQMESFRVDSYTLGSPPEHIGLLPSDTLQRIYVSQQHPVGRMTFIDIETGESRTVTGYELNSQIQ